MPIAERQSPSAMLDIRRRTGVLLLVIVVGQLFLISAQVPSKSGVPVFQAVTFGAFARVQGGASGFLRGIGNIWGNYVWLRGVRAENEELRKQVTDLSVRLQEQSALAQRATRLQELLTLQTSTPVPTLAAEVIAGNPNPGMLTITIGRGSADGVQPDMAVVAAGGVVGRIIGPTAAHAARVQLLIDRNAAAGAYTERTHSGGMVVGVDHDPPLAMDLVSNMADVKSGDLVIASGVDGIYPKGFAIGRVESSERGSGLYRAIAVRPSVDFSSLEEVLVVLVPPRSAVPEDSVPAPAATVGTGK
ncbi:MAG TPA: rod shape-determining protein MreC [Vicinamibacterales bacterium]|nr:rod shape-determining protein MreC [Vicinamibacterales bacterium]